jgi:hypothetical protein
VLGRWVGHVSRVGVLGQALRVVVVAWFWVQLQLGRRVVVHRRRGWVKGPWEQLFVCGWVVGHRRRGWVEELWERMLVWRQRGVSRRHGGWVGELWGRMVAWVQVWASSVEGLLLRWRPVRSIGRGVEGPLGSRRMGMVAFV